MDGVNRKSPVNLVIVEDSLPDVMLVEEALRAQSISYALTHYRDGVEAWNAITNSKASPLITPDLFVLDLNMPRMGGLELLAKLKQNEKLANVPVAILTSSLQPEEKEQARRLGARRFIRKPVDLYDFLAQIGEALKDLVEEEKRGTAEWVD